MRRARETPVADRGVPNFSVTIGLYRKCFECFLQARKRHINIDSLVRLPLGRPRDCRRDKRICPWDKPTLSQGQTQVFSLFYTMEAQFVPGTNPVCPWDNPGDEGRHKRFMCSKFMCLFRSLFLSNVRVKGLLGSEHSWEPQKGWTRSNLQFHISENGPLPENALEQ